MQTSSFCRGFALIAVLLLSATALAQNVDMVVSISDTPDPMTLGTDDISYTITVTNSSGNTANNVSAAFNAPASSTLGTYSATLGGTCNAVSQTVTCTWTSLAAFNSRQVNVDVTPTAGGTLTATASVTSNESDTNTANNNASATTTVNASIDLRVSSINDSIDPITLNTGDVTYTVNIINDSNSKATNPFVTITLPGSSTFVSSSANFSGSCTAPSGGVLTCSWAGDFNAFNGRQATVTVTPTAGGTMTLSATVGGDQPEADNSDNTNTQSTTVNASIDLRVSSIFDSIDPVTLGTGDVTYTITIINDSTSKATNPFVTITLPASSTFVSSTANFSGSCTTPSGGVLTCSWTGDFNAFNSRQATVTVTPTAGGTMTLSATVGGDQPEADNSDNTVSHTTTVNASIDLRTSSIFDSIDPVTLGTGDVTYSINIINDSTSKATNAFVTITLPAGATFVSSSANFSGTCTSPSGGVLTCSWAGDLNAFNGRQATVTVTPTTGGTMTLSATVGGDQPEADNSDNTVSHTTTVNASIDLRTSSIFDSIDPITLGTGDVTYSINIINDSTSKATNAFLTITLPAGATFVSSSANVSGTCTAPSGGVLTCSWAGDLNAFNGRQATVTVTPTAGGTMTLSATVGGDQPEADNSDNTVSHTTTVNASIDLRTSSIFDSIDPITLGTGNVTYSINIINDSTSKATNAFVTITLPAGATFVSSSANVSGTCTAPSGGVLTCSWAGDLNAFNGRQATVTVTPTAGGTMTLSATVGGDQPEADNSDNTLTHDTTVNAQIDLRTSSVFDSIDPITLGTGNVTYTINIINDSTSKATNAFVTITLPAGATFVSSSANVSGTCTAPSGGILTCSWAGDLNAFNGRQATVTVTPTAGGTMTLSATVGGDQPEADNSDNTVSHTTTVNAQIDLRVSSVSDTPDPITLGTGDITYFVTIINDSNSKATNAFVTITLPASSTFVSASANIGGTCTAPSGGVLTCNWAGDLNAFNSRQVTIVVTPTAGGTLTLSATVDGDQPDPDNSDNSGSQNTSVNTTIDLQLTISDFPDPRTLAAGNVTYTVSISNGSSSKATNPVMTFTLPGSATFVSATPNLSGTCTAPSGGVFTCSWTGDLNAFNSRSVSIVVTPTAVGQMSATGSVVSDQGDPNTANNSETETTNINPGSAPTITSFNPTSGPVGTVVTINGSDFFSSTAVKFNAVNSVFSVGSNGVITATVPAGATTGPIAVTNAVGTTISGSNFTVTPAPDLEITKTASAATVPTSSAFDYFINVSNVGAGAANDVTVTDTLPAGVTFNSISAAGWSCSGTTTITCTMGSLASLAAATVITINVTAPATGTTVTNTATVDSTTPDSNAANDSSSVNVGVVGCPSTPPITAPATVCASSTGHTASTPIVPSATYAWTITNGTIVGSSTSDTITFDAGATGPVTLDVAVFVTSCPTAMNSVNVAVSTPTATITPSGPTTFCAGDGVTLTANAGSSWLWSTGATTQSIFVTSGGAYTVDVTDAAGCTATSTGTVVTVNPAPTATITPSGPTTFCDGGSVTLTAPAGMTSYTWSNGETTQSIVVTTSGNYTVSVTNASGCGDTSAPTAVTVLPAPAATITPSGPTTFCTGGSVTLTASAGTSWLWSNGATTQSINVTAGGTFTVDVTNASSCTTTSAPTTVAVNPNPVATITPSGPTTFCDPGSVILTASAGDSWLWSNGATTQSITVTASGTFTVDVTTSGCTTTSAATTVTVDPTPAATITPSGPTTFCDGDSVVLTASPGTSWLWSNGATTQSITVTAGGTFTVDVTNGSCTATSAPTTVTVNPTPVATITPSGPTTFCGPGTVTLTASAGTSWLWSNGATTQSITVTASGTFTVDVTNASGCTDTSVPLTVTMNTTPDATITAPAAVCENSPSNSASVPQQPGASYVWTIANGTINGAANSDIVTFTAGPSGAVTLNATVTLGSCTTSSSASVPISAYPSFAITGPTSVCPSAAFTLSAPAGFTTYLWSTGATTPSITLTQVNPSETYSVTVTNAAGCATTTNHTVTLATPPDATITAPATAGFNENHSASVPLQAGASYIWVITNGVILSGNGSNSISFETGGSGTSTTLDVTVALNGCTSTGQAVITLEGALPECSTLPPIQIVPASNANVPSPVAFHWTALPDAISYELWIDGALIATIATTSHNEPLSSGPHTWHVVANLIGECAPLSTPDRAFTVQESNTCDDNGKPTITAPVAGSTVDTPTLVSWTAVAQAIGYRLFVEVNGGPPQLLGETNGALSLIVSLPPGSIVATVQALFSGCPATVSDPIAFNVSAPDPCATRASATPISPPNGAILNSSSVDLQWLGAFGANGYRVWASIDGATPVVLGTTTDETSLRVNIGRGTVIWWLEALFNGCASTESQRFQFTIPPAENCSTDRPDTIAPADGATIGDGQDVTFTWSAVTDALGYEVYLSHQAGTFSLIGTTDGATSLTRAVPAGELRWFVRVLVNRCPSRDSQRSRFTFDPPEDCVDHRRPVLIEPVDDARSTAPLTFDWNAVDDAIAYELYFIRGNNPPVLVTTTSMTEAVNVSLDTGKLRWFVRALFGQGCPPLDSAEQKLEIVPTPPMCSPLAAPIISAPGQITSGAELRIQWSPVIGATSYQLQISRDGTFMDAETIATNATQHPFTPSNDGNEAIAIHARVLALDSRCTSSFHVSPFSPTAVIFILPNVETNEGSLPFSNPTPLTFTYELGPELAGQTFTALTLHEWLSVSPASGVVGAEGTTLVIAANTNDLPVGTSLGAISITLSTPASGRNAASNNTTNVTPVFNVTLVTPVTPTPGDTPPPDALIIPAVAHAGGINAQFQSDVRVANTSPQLITYRVTFTPSGESGITEGQQSTFSVEPGQTVALDDILRSWFGTGGGNAFGSLEIRPLTQTSDATSGAAFSGLANFTSFASSRTFNVTSNGTFGQYIPAVPFANFIGSAAPGASRTVLSLQQIAQSQLYRTNLGLLEGSGQPASLLVRVFGADGQALTDFPVQLNGGEHLQLGSFLLQQGFNNLTDGRVEIEVLSEGGKVTAYASVIDNVTSDPLLVSPVPITDTGASKWVIAGVADIASGFANWQTDMRLFNAGTEPVEATLQFFSMGGGAPKTKIVTLQPGQVQQYDKALTSLFETTNDGGAVHITTDDPARLVATARTYNQTGSGTYGQFISGVTLAETAGVESRPLQLLQVEESDRFRSNVGITEVTGNPVKVEITIVPPDTIFSVNTELTLQPNEFRQLGSLLASFGLNETHNARVTVRVIEGLGRVTAYASVIDMLTNDPTYVPAQ